jgi:hypothetical protein
MNCDKHYTIVASKPGVPGAYASCTDDPTFLGEWAVIELLRGSILKKVTCNQAAALRQEYLDWCDKQDAAKAELKRVQKAVDKNRREAMAKPIPRNECPGCFSIIYDDAAAQGWCTNCFPHRAKYEKKSKRAAHHRNLQT